MRGKERRRSIAAGVAGLTIAALAVLFLAGGRAPDASQRGPAVQVRDAAMAALAGRPTVHRHCPATARPHAGTIVTGGISYPLSVLRALQRAADRHSPCAAYALNPVKVTVHDLPAYGFTPGRITIVRPPPPHVAPTAHHGEDGLPETDVVVRFRGREYWIVLNQFIRHGPGGIWSIITITGM